MYSIHNDLLLWVESYLTDRYQGVWIDHIMSPFLSRDVGVPQGSNLGPLFFLIFANDLPYMLSCSTDQYADDSTLSSTEKTVEGINENLEDSREAVCNWMEENKLKLNADKTHVMTLGTDQRLKMPGNKVTVKMDGVTLEESDNQYEIMLGVFIQTNLKWNKQIKNLLGKLKKRIAGLTHLKYVLPYNFRKIVSEGI